MQNNEYKDINLRETGIYDSRYSFNELLKQNNITTLSQILDDELMRQVVKNTSSKKVLEQLNGYISLLKYKYLDIPFDMDCYLEKRACKVDRYASKIYMSGVKYFFNDVNFSKMGFNLSSHLTIMLSFATTLGNKMYDIQLINFFKLLVNKTSNASLNQILEIYINLYNKEHASFKDVNKYADEIQFLKEKIKLLDDIKKDLEYQIAILQNNFDFSEKDIISHKKYMKIKN